MGKYRTKSSNKDGSSGALSVKIKKRRSKTAVKQNKTKKRKRSDRRCSDTYSAKHRCSQEAASTSSNKSCSINVPVIEAKPCKIHSLNPYKGFWDHDVASFSSMIVLGDGQKVIAGGYRYTLLFPKQMRHFTSEYGRTTALDVALYYDNVCVVLGHDGVEDELCNFHFLEIRDNNFTEIGHKIKPLTGYKPIAITSCNNKVYVLCNTDPPSLKQFTKDRPEPIWSRQTGEDGLPLFRNPACITSFYTTKGVSLVVADKHDDRVACFNLLDGAKGRLIKSQKALGRNVVGMTTDRYDNIFVCYNSPNAISVLQNDLSHERFVYKSRNIFTNLSCLAYDKTNETLLLIDNGQMLHTLSLSYK